MQPRRRRRVLGTPTERFWAYVEKTPTCWLWTGYRLRGTYGMFYPKPKEQWYAHRYSYTLAHGPIPPGLVVRHLCHVQACVRPEHLALGTQADNIADKVAAGRSRNTWQLEAPHCSRGHAWTPENIYYPPTRPDRPYPERQCRSCRRLRARGTAEPYDFGSCYRGHPWAPETTYYSRNGTRRCAICARDTSRQSYIRRRQAAGKSYRSYGPYGPRPSKRRLAGKVPAS